MEEIIFENYKKMCKRIDKEYADLKARYECGYISKNELDSLGRKMYDEKNYELTRILVACGSGRSDIGIKQTSMQDVIDRLSKLPGVTVEPVTDLFLGKAEIAEGLEDEYNPNDVSLTSDVGIEKQQEYLLDYEKHRRISLIPRIRVQEISDEKHYVIIGTRDCDGARTKELDGRRKFAENPTLLLKPIENNPFFSFKPVYFSTYESEGWWDPNKMKLRPNTTENRAGGESALKKAVDSELLNMVRERYFEITKRVAELSKKKEIEELEEELTRLKTETKKTAAKLKKLNNLKPNNDTEIEKP